MSFIKIEYQNLLILIVSEYHRILHVQIQLRRKYRHGNIQVRIYFGGHESWYHITLMIDPFACLIHCDDGFLILIF